MMDLDTIKSKRKHGDLKLAANLAHIPYVDAKKALARKKSKYHYKLIIFLSQIISNRESLIHRPHLMELLIDDHKNKIGNK